MAQKTLKLMDKVGSSLLGTKTVGEKPSVFKTKSLAMMLDRQIPSKIGGKTLSDGDGDGGVALPSAATLFGDEAEKIPSVDSQVRVPRRQETQASISEASSTSDVSHTACLSVASIIFRHVIRKDRVGNKLCD